MTNHQQEAPSSSEGVKAIDPFDPASFANEPAIMTSKTSEQDATPVKVLVFDMGHVFVDFDWSAVCKGFMDRAGMNSEQFKEVLAFVGTLGYEDGRIMTDGFVKALNDKLSTELTVEEFEAMWNFGFHENEEMASLLSELGKHYPLYLLSNTNESHYEFLSRNFKVERHFKELILSYKVGLAKPDKRIYEEVIKRSGHAAAEHLFVDDLERNIQGALSTGMRAIRFVDIDDLKANLRAHGVTV